MVKTKAAATRRVTYGSRPFTVGITGPSTFTADLVRMVEDLWDGDVVPLYQNRQEGLQRWLRECDAVILGGGRDIHPATYGGHVLNHKGYTGFDLDRDVREMFVLGECFQDGRPVMGVCRGHQLLGVAKHMKLNPNLTGPVCHNPSANGVTLGEREPAHRVTLATDEFDHAAWYVNSFHHQGIALPRTPPPGVKILGVTGKVVELMEGDGFLGVQWHPEHDWQHNVGSRAVLERFRIMVEVA